MRSGFTRREAIAATLVGVTVATIVWGPILLRPLSDSMPAERRHTVAALAAGGSAVRAPASPPRTSKAAPTARIDINHADPAILQTLPGIGPTLARRIVSHRAAHGSFDSPERLLEVPGIGARRLERLRPWIEAR